MKRVRYAMNLVALKAKKIIPALSAGVLVFGLGHGCAPQPRYRTPIPASGNTAGAPKAPPAPPPVTEAMTKPLPQEAKIREQDLKPKAPIAPAAKEPAKPASGGEIRAAPESTTPALPDDSSLLAKITPGTPPQRAASLRLTEEGRKLLDTGNPIRALNPLERTIVVDSTNPYGYFYLAKAQYKLGRYQESLNFLDVAESRLGAEPFWLAEVHALRGENFRALGMTQKAEASFSQALRLNSGNRTASDALSRMQGESPSVPR
jgi:hypothetical protein